MRDEGRDMGNQTEMLMTKFSADEDVHPSVEEAFTIAIANTSSVQVRSLLSMHLIAADILEHPTIENRGNSQGTLLALVSCG